MAYSTQVWSSSGYSMRRDINNNYKRVIELLFYHPCRLSCESGRSLLPLRLMRIAVGRRTHLTFVCMPFSAVAVFFGLPGLGWWSAPPSLLVAFPGCWPLCHRCQWSVQEMVVEEPFFSEWGALQALNRHSCFT